MNRAIFLPLMLLTLTTIKCLNSGSNKTQLSQIFISNIPLIEEMKKAKQPIPKTPSVTKPKKTDPVVKSNNSPGGLGSVSFY